MYAECMLDYAHQRAAEMLQLPRTIVLVTSGPAGLQAGRFACQAIGLDLYLLVPRTSDQLFNLEHDSSVLVLAPGWELKGEAQRIPAEAALVELNLLQEPAAPWCVLVQVKPRRLQIHRTGGWGNLETLDLIPD
jgi:hypothetical protein